jgi:hypothetical protein
LATTRRTTRAVAEVFSKDAVVSLHSRCGTGVAISDSAIDHIEAFLPLIQPQLEVGIATPREVLRAPLDVEDPVRRRATSRSEDSKPTVYQVQVVPVRVDRVIVAVPRQATVSKGGVRGFELGIAVGRQIDAGESLVVQRVTEGKHDVSYGIIPVITDVRCAWHDAAANLSYYVEATRC